MPWDRIIKDIIKCGVVLITLALLGWMLVTSLNYPIVYVSRDSGKCVEVEDVNNRYTCDNLPDRYHQVWVP